MRHDMRSNAGRVILLGLAAAFGLGRPATAGPLEPPGPPAPTMKTIEQAEPRIPITSLPLTISSGGSYYLTKDFTLSGSVIGINVTTTASVTIDLNGFALDGGGTGVAGIQQLAGENLTVKNGTIRRWATGINAAGVYQQLENVVIRFSSATAAALTNANISRSFLLDGVTGISSLGVLLIKDTRVSGYTNIGIDARGPRNVIESCIIDFNGTGVRLGRSSILRDSTITENSGTGAVLLETGTFVSGNNFSANGGNGMLVSDVASLSVIEGNSFTTNGLVGINVQGSRSMITRNRAAANSSGNYTNSGTANIIPIEFGTVTNAVSNISN